MPISNSILSKIHIARQQLQMDDHGYRSLLNRISGVQSAKQLDAKQASLVLQEFERLGWRPKPAVKAQGKPKNFAQLPNQIKKVEALLADMGLPWAYADALSRQMFKVQRVSWLRKYQQLDAIIAALHVEQEKRALFARVEALLKLLGECDSNWRADLEQLPNGWERRRPILTSLVETLESAAAARGLL